MTDQQHRINRLNRWLVVASSVVIIANFAFFLTLPIELQEKPVVESHETSSRDITLDRMNDLDKKIETLNSQAAQLTQQLHALKGRFDSSDQVIARQAGEQREGQARFNQLDAGVSELNQRIEDLLPRLSTLEQAADTMQVKPPEPALQTAEPFAVSSLMRWGEQRLAVVKTPAGYHALGVGDRHAGWRVANIELSENRVTLIDTVSGREVVQSPGGNGETGTLHNP